MKILVLNSGSSSQKACLFYLGEPLPDVPPEPLWEGKMEWRDNLATLETRTSSGAVSRQELARRDRVEATAQLLDALVSGETRVLGELAEIGVVGHRIVNGGREYTRPTWITQEVKAAIEKMAAFAPLHNRVELEGIAMIEKNAARYRRSRCSIPHSTLACRRQRRSIPDRTSGCSEEFASLVFTESTMSTAPGERHKVHRRTIKENDRRNGVHS